MWERTATAPAELGIVAYFPPRPHCTRSGGWCAEQVLVYFVPSRQYIGQLELLAAVAAYRTFARELRDDTSALAALLIKGYSSRPDSALIIHAFLAFNVGLGTRVWFEYVASKANIAGDMPSRGEFGLLREMGSI
eukprot:5630276-Pleurochrysis_carterae.AAC.2